MAAVPAEQWHCIARCCYTGFGKLWQALAGLLCEIAAAALPTELQQVLIIGNWAGAGQQAADLLPQPSMQGVEAIDVGLQLSVTMLAIAAVGAKCAGGLPLLP